MNAAVPVYAPQVDVRAWTPDGRFYHADLMGDLKQIQTHKDTVNPAGTFVLTFTSRQDAAGSWASKLPPRTYVEIRAGVAQRGNPPILMRGFVDQSQQVMAMPPQTGGPQRQVQIVGRDYGGLLADWQLLYLWAVDPMSTLLAAAIPGYPVNSVNFNIPLDPTQPQPVGTALQQIVDHMIAPSVDALRNALAHAPLPALRTWIYLPSRFTINFMNVEPWTGVYWNLINFLASPPLGEAFVFDDDPGPTLVVRRTPYKAWDGTYPLESQDPAAHGFFPDITVDGGALAAGQQAAHQLGMDASEVFTYYFVMPDQADMFNQPPTQFFYAEGQAGAPGTNVPASAFEGASANPIFDADQAQRYGLRVLQIQTPWVYLGGTSDTATYTAMAAKCAELATWCYQVFRYNDRYVGGTITLHGHEQYRVGRYVRIPPWRLAFYLQGVDHLINISDVNATWQTTLTVVRGQEAA
ncbi:MAG: hypothetical protein K6V97_03840 [Actinomycetia bacterium]|nr:hypothetical protein [Actinomycetes bacterium]